VGDNDVEPGEIEAADWPKILEKLAKTLALSEPLVLKSYQVQHYETAHCLKFNALTPAERWDLELEVASDSRSYSFDGHLVYWVKDQVFEFDQVIERP
jgi:hypothetical protein